MNISYQWLTQGGVEMPQLDFPLVEQWIGEVAVRHGFAARALTYIFCDDDTIIDVNRRFLNHDYFTDIITFDYTRGKFLRGDMYISLDTVGTNADLVGQPYGRELLRVVIHGILHLCGINDKGPGERDIMEKHENEALALYDEMLRNI